MSQFIIHTHGRLQEWIAEEKGYYAKAGLMDYTLQTMTLPAVDAVKPEGAYQSFEAGRDASVSCACHWTVNMAAANGHGKLWSGSYSVSPAGIFVADDAPYRRLGDLANVPVDVGYQSGSHYATIQALETSVAKNEVKLAFTGRPNTRLERLVNGETQAATLFGAQLYAAEQLGLRRIADLSFMIAAMVPEDAETDDVIKYFEALRLAQREIDLDHQSYTHYFLNDLPEAYREQLDPAAFGPGERIVFEPYSSEIFERTQTWVAEHGIFEPGKHNQRGFEDAVAAP